MIVPTPMKVVLTLFIIVLIGLGFFLVDWQKKIATQKMLAARLSQKSEELSQQEGLAQELPSQRKKNERLKEELRVTLKEQLTPEREADFVPAYIADVEKLVDYVKREQGDQNFLITGLSPGMLSSKGQEGEKESILQGLNIPTRTFHMQLTGTYVSVVEFLRQLGALRLKRLVTVDRIQLSPTGEIVSSRPPVLSISMPVTAYLRQGAGH